MSDREAAIQRIHALVDSYHSLSHPPDLGILYELRRELVVALFKLTSFVKGDYGKKGLSYVMRKYATAREISVAIDNDKKGLGSKPRPMNMLEVQTEALDHVLQTRKEEVAAEAEWEETVATIKSCDKALGAMMQEIADGRKERDYQSYLEGLQKKEQSEQH